MSFAYATERACTLFMVQADQVKILVNVLLIDYVYPSGWIAFKIKLYKANPRGEEGTSKKTRPVAYGANLSGGGHGRVPCVRDALL